MMYNDVVKIVQKNYSPGRSVMLTLQYRFNTTRDRYRGTGAGNSEIKILIRSIIKNIL